MRKTLVLIVLSATLIIAGCSSQKQLRDENLWSEYEVRIYQVYGMDCPGCHGGLEKLVNKIDGVHDSSANWEKSELKVAVKPGSVLDDSEIIKAVEKANFTSGKRIM